MTEQRIISVISLKGGVGKTTSSVNIAACLANAGKKTLLIDLDPHTGASLHLGLDLNNIEYTVTDVITDEEFDVRKAICKTDIENLFLLPSHHSLASVEAELEGEIGRENLLNESLKGKINDFEYVIIDSPPTASFLTFTALRAAKEVLIPFKTNFMCVEASKELNTLVDKVQRRLNPDIKVLGYFGTMYEPRTVESQQSVKDMQNILGDKVFKTLIPSTVALAQASRSGQSIIEYSKKSIGTKSYQQLVKEVFGV